MYGLGLQATVTSGRRLLQICDKDFFQWWKKKGGCGRRMSVADVPVIE